MTASASPPPTFDAARAVLALDTSAGQCSVALRWGLREAYRVAPMTQGHSRVLLGMIDAVMVELGCDATHIAAVGYGSGPGSFTGLRVACGVAQGLALGWDCPVVAVDTPCALAVQAALARDPDRARPDDLIAVALDLRMHEFCCALFQADVILDAQAWPQPIGGLQLGPQAQAVALFASHVPGGESAPGAQPMSSDALGHARSPAGWLAGDGFDVGEALRAWSAPLVQAGRRPMQAVQPDARAVAHLAARGLMLGRGLDAADAAPFYLRDKVALDVTEQAALRAARAATAVAPPAAAPASSSHSPPG